MENGLLIFLLTAAPFADVISMKEPTMNKKWSEQGIEPGWIVQLKSVYENEALDTETDNYIIANHLDRNYSLVSLRDGEVIATADSVDCLKSAAEKACDSRIELVDAWSNARYWGIDL